jgi:hypothetical protein
MGIDADFLRRQQEASVIRLGDQHAEPGHDGAQRRRYATRDELADILARSTPLLRLANSVSGVGIRAVLDALTEQGVDVEALVKITVREV